MVLYIETTPVGCFLLDTHTHIYIYIYIEYVMEDSDIWDIDSNTWRVYEWMNVASEWNIAVKLSSIAYFIC